MQDISLFTMQVFTHYVRITNITPRMQMLLIAFKRRYVQYGLVRERRAWVNRPLKDFFGKTTDGAEWRFHINQLPEFQRFLNDNYIKPHLYKVVKCQLHRSLPLKATMKEGLSLYDYQVPIVDYATKQDRSLKLVEIQTGKGKGRVSIWSACQLGLRTLVLVKPKYELKWCKELIELTTAKTKDIMTVSGAGQIRGVVDLADNDQLNVDFIVLSTRTLQMFIKAYYEDRRKCIREYGFAPEELFERLGIGTIIHDELHEEFHANFMSMLHINVANYIGLTATLLTKNTFLMNIYKEVLPLQSRYNGLEYDKYIHAFAVGYEFELPQYIRTSQPGSTMYSHDAFERSIMRHKGTLKSYLKMIEFWVQKGYFERMLKGQKCAIFATSIDMCTEITKYFQEHYPQFKVARFVEEDPYEDLLTADIVVTTVLSGGTGFDIPGLITVIQTINILSYSSNVQTMGRLRKIDGTEVQFYYLYCINFDKHIEYHKERKEVIRPRVDTFKEVMYHKRV